MIPPNRIDQHMRDLSDRPNPLDEPPVNAGPLAGKFSSPLAIAATGGLILLVSVSLFAVAYVMDRSATLFEFPRHSENAVLGLWIFGWIAMVCALLFLLFGAAIRKMRQIDLEEEMFKIEPRDFEFPATVNQHVVEVVKVRCRYCGTLNDASAKNCIACGATM